MAATDLVGLQLCSPILCTVPVLYIGKVVRQLLVNQGIVLSGGIQ